MIQAGPGEARLQCSKQAGICTALITAALEGKRVDSWVEGRGQGENRRQAIRGLKIALKNVCVMIYEM